MDTADGYIPAIGGSMTIPAGAPSRIGVDPSEIIGHPN
jgi:hypothetical protein